jgi:hypothetical protein
MSTTADDLKIDLDALDAKNAEKEAKSAEKDAKKPKNGADALADPAIEVVKADPAPKVDDKPILTPDAGLDKLKKQLEEEKTARLDADRRAQEATDSELRARTEVQSSQLDLVTTAIASVKQSNEALKSSYAEALAAQDYAKVADVQMTMSENAAKLLQLEQGKTALEKAPKPVARPLSDPVEQFAARLTPQSAAWVRAHPEYVRDPKKNREMLAAHELAMARGVQADTEDYFDSIERTLNLTAEPVLEIPPEDPMKDAAKPRARAAPAAAPVTRSGNGAGSRPNVVTLTPQEVEMAKMMQMTNEEYARNKVALKREGRLQ